MVWSMSGVSKLTISVSLIFLLNAFSFIWIGFFSSDTKSLKLNVMMDMKNPSHLVTNILKLIDERKFEKLEHDAYDENMHCYECLIVKTPFMYHCRQCDSCIDFHHKHSEFLGKCIGRDNAIAYFWFLFTNTCLNVALIYCLINCLN